MAKNGNYLIGLIKPSKAGRGSVEAQMQRMLPSNFTLTSVSLGIGDLVESQISAALARIEEAARELASMAVAVITMGGTPPIVVGGYGFDTEIIERIGRVTPIPATTSQTSANKAMNLLGAKKIVVVTPFKEEINRAVTTYLEASGFQIGSFKTAKAPFEEFPNIPSSVPYELALEGVKESPDAKCVFIPCAAWPVSDIIEPLEKEIGLPVIASAQVEIWGALRLIGTKTPIQGYGRILRDY